MKFTNFSYIPHYWETTYNVVLAHELQCSVSNYYKCIYSYCYELPLQFTTKCCCWRRTRGRPCNTWMDQTLLDVHIPIESTLTCALDSTRWRRLRRDTMAAATRKTNKLSPGRRRYVKYPASNLLLAWTRHPNEIYMYQHTDGHRVALCYVMITHKRRQCTLSCSVRNVFMPLYEPMIFMNY